jgi:hypothetical protein
MRVIELRNYLLKDGATGEFIRYFEEHFLFSQRDEGMQILGQFEVVGEPRRFVWIRGFESMAARLRGLSGFYGGPFWLAHRARANAMMLEHHDVHLLRPLGGVTTLTGGLGLEDRMAEPPGLVRADAGLVAVDFYRARPGRLDAVLGFFEQSLQPALVARGQEVLGHFVAELAPNDYPRLPVTQDADLLVVLSAYPDRERRASLGGRLAPAEEMRALLAADVSTILLRPTAKSLIRWHAA